MRLLKLAGGIALLALVVAGLASPGGASAARPEFTKPGGGAVAGTPFTFTSKESEIDDAVSGYTIKCKLDKGSGEITGPKEAKASFDFEKCSVAALAAQSLGDKGGKILMDNLVGELCYIEPNQPDVGILFKLPKEGIHIEVPALGELVLLTGSFVGLIDPLNAAAGAFTLDVSDMEKCLNSVGNEDVLLLEKEHNKATLAVELFSEESITIGNNEKIEILA